jgi:hypothetical protein
VQVGPKTYEKRLLQVKGTMGNVVAKKVPLSWESLNRGDCFVYGARFFGDKFLTQRMVLEFFTPVDGLEASMRVVQ